MKINSLFAFSLSLTITVSFLAQAEPNEVRPEPRPDTLFYQVKTKDHLAEVLRSIGFRDLWGRNGIVSRTINANDRLKKNPNDLAPGSWLYIPTSQLPKGSSYVVIDGVVIDGEKQKNSTPKTRPQEGASNSTWRRSNTEPLPPLEQIIQVQCPDQSSRDARVQLLPSKAPGRTALLVVLDKEGICVPSNSPPATAVSEAPALVAADVTVPDTKTGESPIESARPEEQTIEKSSEKPIEKIVERSNPNRIEELHPENTILTPPSRDISQLPFIVSPLFSYISNSLQFGGAMGSPNTSGITYGARLGYAYRKTNWAFLIDASYRIGQMTTTEATNDFLAATLIEYGLGISYQHWILRGGLANNSMSDASQIANISFADKGYYASLAYSFFFNARTSWSLEGRYTGITYAKANNSSLVSDTPSTQLEILATYDYRFAIW